MNTKKNVKIVQDEENVIEREVLAAAVIRISDAAGKLLKSGLSRNDLVALIKERTGYGANKEQISTVLNAIDVLRQQYES